MSDRPFKVLGLQQIAVGGTDKDRLRTLWIDLFGLSPGGNYLAYTTNQLGKYKVWIIDTQTKKKKAILTKEWQQKDLQLAHNIPAGIVVVLGTKSSIKLTLKLFQ